MFFKCLFIVAHAFITFLCIDLRAATNLSTTLTKLDPLTVELKWSLERGEQSLSPTGFKVVAMADNSSILPESMIDHQATLKLKHDTVYKLKVITNYGEFTNRESKEIEFKSPKEDEGL